MTRLDAPVIRGISGVTGIANNSLRTNRNRASGADIDCSSNDCIFKGDGISGQSQEVTVISRHRGVIEVRAVRIKTIGGYGVAIEINGLCDLESSGIGVLRENKNVQTASEQDRRQCGSQLRVHFQELLRNPFGAPPQPAKKS